MHKLQYRFLQSMIAGGLAAILTAKLLDGKLSFFINLRFAPLTAIAILILLIISGVGAMEMESKMRPIAPERSTTTGRIRQFLFLPFLPFFASLIGLSTPVYITVFCLVFITGIIRLAQWNAAQSEDNSVFQYGSWVNLFLMALPLVILAFVPSKPLSVEALSTRSINVSAPSTLGKQSPLTIKAELTDRTILDWVTTFDSEPDTTKFLGTDVSVIGFVFHENRLPAGQFMIGRFTITCCVADAFAVAMVVDSPGASSLANDEWVKVEGKLDETTVGGIKVPMIRAASITQIDAPEQPYLYP